MIKIYAILCPKTKEVRYVGKTVKSLGVRLSSHLYESKVSKNKTHKHNWILKSVRDGFRPEIKLLEECTEENWEEREIYWITIYKSQTLTNTAPGGQGGCSKKLSNDHKRKIRETLLRKIKSGEIDNNNPERVAKLRAHMLGRTVTEETRDKLRKANLGKKQSLECRIKKSKGVLQYDLEGNFIAEHISLNAAAKSIDGSKGNISNVCCGRSNTHKGFIWKYKHNKL